MREPDPRLPPATTFSQTEVEQIFALAATLQRQAESRSDGALSLTQLEAVAQEAGLDPALVRRAAEAVRTGQAPAAGSRVLGAPTRICYEREIPGELDPCADGELVELARRLVGQHGHTERVGRMLSWWTRRTASTVRVTVVTRPGWTRLRVEQLNGEFAFGIHMLTGFGGLFGGGIAAGIVSTLAAPALAAVGAMLAVTGGGLALGRFLFRRGSARDAVTLEGVTSEVAAFIEASIANGRGA